MLLTDRSVVSAERPAGAGRVTTQFAFRPGPVDWPDGRHLDFGMDGGFGLKIVKFYRHARETVDWVANPSRYDGPALKLVLCGPRNYPLAEDWLAANAFGGEAVIGPSRFVLLPLPLASMLDDFLHPPADDFGEAGILSIHHEGRLQRVRVDDHLGRTIPLGESGIAVELVEYLPNARPTAHGKFTSKGADADNPMLELLIHLPGREKPLRQIAFAKLPLLNLDGVHGISCPVKFWYHHANAAVEAGATFAQTPDGELYCRAVAGGANQPPVAIRQGDRVPVGEQFRLEVAEYLPRARQQVSFWPIELAPGETPKGEAAVLVEVASGNTRQQAWLKRHDEQYGHQVLMTPQGPISLSFGYDQTPLGFQLHLKDFTRRMNPGRMGDAAFASSVRLVDAAAAVDREHEISMNEPLVYGKFTFYQSSFQQLPGGIESSVLTAAYDPGRLLKYAGSLMICGGIFIMFYMRSYMFKKVPSMAVRPHRPEVISMRHSIAPLVFLAFCSVLSVPSPARGSGESTFHWDSWRHLPVQEGGRHKPLDTLAWETMRTLSNRAHWTDLETGQTLNPPTFYLAMLFDWQGWDKAGGPPLAMGEYWRATYYQMHQPDKWDCAPLLRVDYLPLRKALGLNDTQKYVSPRNLSQSKIEVPGSEQKKPFLRWAEGLVSKQQQGLTLLEKKSLELADRLWSYQDHRMGRRLQILPDRAGEGDSWLSLDQLMRMPLDDSTDPTGVLRQAKQHFQELRAGYLASSPGQFNQATAEFISCVQRYGRQSSHYPSQRLINLEVGYNRWVPFRFAWALTLLALLLLLLSMGTGWRLFYAAGWVSFSLGLAAMIIGFGVAWRSPAGRP